MSAPIVTIPQLAVRFSLWKVHPRKGTNTETGKKYKVNANERLYGDADKATGEVAETWPVAAWNTKTIVERWGPARYMVHWLDEGGNRIGTKTFLLDSPRRGKASINVAKDDDPAAPATSGSAMAARESFGPFEVFQMLREERAEAEARVRADADRAAERERAHQQAQMAMMLELVKAQRATAPQAASFDPNLIRRELAVTVREQMQQIRAELTGLVPQPDAPGGDEAPENLEDAAEQVGIELLKQVAKDAPGVLQKAIPSLLDWMKRHGVEPNPAIQAKLDGAARARQAAEAAAAALSNGAGELEEDDDANAG